MKECTAIKAPNVSVAWLRAVEHLLNCGHECFNLMVIIQRPTESEPPIHQAYEELVAAHGLLSLKQVTYTIFPRSVYLEAGKDPDRLFERYNRPGGIYDRLRRKHGRRFGWGSYFRRMTHYTAADKGDLPGVNQLGEIIVMMRGRARRYKAAYTISIQIPGVDGRRTRGGPCLSHLALQLERPRVLNLMAVYRNHDFIQRAYGNYLGLGYLMEFICDQTGYTVGSLRCLSSHASISNLAAATSWPTTSGLRQLIQDLKKA